MTIASELLKLQNNLDNSYTACQNKGATLPASQNFDNLASTISAIPAGTTPTLASLTVTPSTTAQTLTPPSGTDGYNTVIASAVTASIDNNITAGNIKSGVTILGVTGTLQAGGTTPTGTYTITANGTYDVKNYASADVNVSGGGGSTTRAFTANFWVDTEGYVHNIGVDIDGTEIAEHVLAYNDSVIDIESAYSNMYENLDYIEKVDLSSLITISGDYAMDSAFYNCTGLTSVDLSSLTTVSGYQAMLSAFRDCVYLISVDLSSLTTVSGYQAMSSAFRDCTDLTSVDLSSLTTVSDSAAMSSAFRGCLSLQTLSFPSLNSNSFGSYTNQFNAMLSGVTGCTVHFPSNLQSVIGSWTSVTAGFSGTNTTVLFDLPATT